MFQKICNYLSILTTILTLGILGSGFVTFKYVTSPEFERTIKNKIMGSLEDKLPDVMGSVMPDLTGPSIQLPEANKVNPFGNPTN